MLGGGWVRGSGNDVQAIEQDKGNVRAGYPFAAGSAD